jgi:hypothetical protein
MVAYYYAAMVRRRAIFTWSNVALELALLVTAACRGQKPIPSADSSAPTVDATAPAPGPKAQQDPAPCPPAGAFGDTPNSLLSDVEYACFRARDGRTGQWSQIAGLRSRTWLSLVERTDSFPLGNADSICAHAEIQRLMRTRCAEDTKSHCCPP